VEVIKGYEKRLVYRIVVVACDICFFYYSNTEEFSFYWSLFFGLIPLFFFGSGTITWFMALMFHYFIYWKQIHPLLEKKYNSEKER
jgi:hypothetical protein